MLLTEITRVPSRLPGGPDVRRDPSLSHAVSLCQPSRKWDSRVKPLAETTNPPSRRPRFGLFSLV
jgi:hypothetical protein